VNRVFGSEALDVVFGLIFIYLALSLICSALNETLASISAWRAEFLRKGIRNLLGDPDGNGLSKEVYEHPLIRSITRRIRVMGNRYPSYLPSRTFALALLDLVAGETVQGARPPTRRALPKIERSFENISNEQVRRVVQLLFKEAGGNLEEFRRNVERWFDEGMGRVSGWYRRRVHLFLWILAIALSVILNVDSFQIAAALWKDDTVRSALVAQAEEVAAQPAPEGGAGEAPPESQSIKEVAAEVEALRALNVPLGWSLQPGDPRAVPRSAGGWVTKVIGLLLTAAALTFGAPFWFDVLKRVAQVRSAGAPPGRGSGGHT
jgi:hypothetical protein